MKRLNRRGRRSIAFVTALTASSVALTLVAPGANAITIPVWPSSGYLPTCSFTLLGSPTTFYDNTKARVASVTTPAALIRVGNTPVIGRIDVKAIDTCSGVQSVAVVVRSRTSTSTSANAGSFYPTSTNIWTGTWSIGFPVDASPGHYGNLQVAAVGVVDRYRQFQLDLSNKWVGSFTPSDPTDDVWSELAKPLVIKAYRLTTLSANATPEPVRKGATVTVKGVLKMANGVSYSPIVGARVYLQRRYTGIATWSNVASAVARASGAVAITNKPTKNVTYRLVYFGSDTILTAPVTSGADAVTVR